MSHRINIGLIVTVGACYLSGPVGIPTLFWLLPLLISPSWTNVEAWVSSSLVGLEISEYPKWVIKILVFTASFRTVRCRRRRHRISVLEFPEFKKTLIWKIFNTPSCYQCLNVTSRMVQGCPSTSLVPGQRATSGVGEGQGPLAPFP